MSEMNPEVRIARENGFDIWDVGGGLTAFGRVIHESADGEEQVVAMITPGENGVGHEGDPDTAIWGTGVDATTARGGENVYSADGLTLQEAIVKAAEFESLVLKTLETRSVADLVHGKDCALPAVSGFGF